MTMIRVMVGSIARELRATARHLSGLVARLQCSTCFTTQRALQLEIGNSTQLNAIANTKDYNRSRRKILALALITWISCYALLTFSSAMLYKTESFTHILATCFNWIEMDKQTAHHTKKPEDERHPHIYANLDGRRLKINQLWLKYNNSLSIYRQDTYSTGTSSTRHCSQIEHGELMPRSSTKHCRVCKCNATAATWVQNRSCSRIRSTRTHLYGCNRTATWICTMGQLLHRLNIVRKTYQVVGPNTRLSLAQAEVDRWG